MYHISPELLGERLKKVRLHLGINQVELAEKLKTTQSALSRIERGQGGTSTLLTALFCFYSQFIYINSLFLENFHLINIEQVSKSNLESIIVEIVETALKEHAKDTIQASEKLRNSLERATDLLK